MGTLSEILSKYAVGLNYEDLPEEVIKYTKVLLLDTFGVALGGKPVMKSGYE